MNDLQSRWEIHVVLEGFNTKAASLAGGIKRNFEEVGV